MCRIKLNVLKIQHDGIDTLTQVVNNRHRVNIPIHSCSFTDTYYEIVSLTDLLHHVDWETEKRGAINHTTRCFFINGILGVYNFFAGSNLTCKLEKEAVEKNDKKIR